MVGITWSYGKSVTCGNSLMGKSNVTPFGPRMGNKKGKEAPNNTGNGGGGSMNDGERLAILEEKMKHLATRELIIESCSTLAHTVNNYRVEVSQGQTISYRWYVGLFFTVVIGFASVMVKLYID